MKLGCAVWTFCEDKYNPPYEPSIEIIGRLGFEGIELILFAEEHLNSFYNQQKIKSIRELLNSQNLKISELSIHGEVVGGLSSVDNEVKDHALEVFKKASKLAHELGSPIVNTVASWPYGLKAPAPYPPAYIHPSVVGPPDFEPKWKMDLPEDFDWDGMWKSFVASINSCADIASDQGLKFTLEGHANVMMSSTDAFLRLCDHVNSQNLGMNFDTGWQFVQREYLPLAIHKLKNKLLHTHIRDGDGLFCYLLPPGLGIIDWESVIKALADINYSGYLTFEVPLIKNTNLTASYIQNSAEYIRDIMKKVL